MRYVLCIIVLAMSCVQGAYATPRVPTHLQEVIAILPTKMTTPVVAQNLSLEQSLLQIQALLVQAEKSGDPRYLGYAEAQLQPFINQSVVDDEVLLLRAKIYQFNHRFAQAQIDIAQVLQHQPTHPQALLLQASIYQVRADFDLARHSCQRLRTLNTLSLAVICEAQVNALNGRAAQSMQTMHTLLANVNSLEPSQQTWFYLGLGDVAMRQGDFKQAETYYRRLDINQPVALAALADVLLAQKRYAEVSQYLRNYQQHDALLLRFALAQQALKLPVNELINTLNARFAALRLRGDNSHLREQAMFSLQLLDQPQQALLLARQNWQQQREPQDAQIYWSSAQATQAKNDLNILKTWLQQTQLQDITFNTQTQGASK